MKTTKKNLALLELILAILFFALSSAVLMQVFAKAKAVGDTSRASTLGLVAAQDIVERLKAAPWDAERILPAEAGWMREGPGGGRGASYIAGYGGDMRLTTGDASYAVRVAVQEEPRAAGAIYRISVGIDRLPDQGSVLQLATACYVPAGREEEP